MRSSHLSPALLVILLLGAATQASTQSVILGSVREAGSEVAISTAEIRLADAEGRIITSDLTDDQGRFRLEVESRGDYSLSVRRIGYARIERLQGHPLAIDFRRSAERKGTIRLCDDGHPTERDGTE
jgi:hypothetical protein